MAEAIVIFDVDGVLLELTPAEEAAFFWPFEELHGLTGLSPDWDSYRIRNDEDIIAEILENHFARPPSDDECAAIVATYLDHLGEGLRTERVVPLAMEGARELLEQLAAQGFAAGIATANLREAARMRLDHAGLWARVMDHAHGADGGGPKRDILARAVAASGFPRDRVVYVGDNLSDFDAGCANDVHFVGFAADAIRRQRLSTSGAKLVSGDHGETMDHIRHCLGL
jgi:phosphoglycolate phosphatase-like HAD superfamily hydrolase